MSSSAELEFFKAMLALIGGLVGAFVGARLALNRFKKERSYDKRLEWHLGALRAVHNMDAQMMRAGTKLLERPPEYVEAEAQFQRVMVESRAFMRRRDAERLRNAYHGFFKAEIAAVMDAARGEESETIGQATRYAREKIGEVEDSILTGLTRLMPSEDDARWHRAYQSVSRRLIPRNRAHKLNPPPRS